MPTLYMPIIIGMYNVLYNDNDNHNSATPTSRPDQLETACYGPAESLQQALEAALELESCQLASRKLDCESAAEKDQVF